MQGFFFFFQMYRLIKISPSKCRFPEHSHTLMQFSWKIICTHTLLLTQRKPAISLMPAVKIYLNGFQVFGDLSPIKSKREVTVYLRLRGTCYHGNKRKDRLPPCMTVIAMVCRVDMCHPGRSPYNIVLSQDVLRTGMQSGSTANNCAQVQG